MLDLVSHVYVQKPMWHAKYFTEFYNNILPKAKVNSFIMPYVV